MGGQKFQYDESGGTFFYFLLSFLALILIPATWYYWPRKVKQDPEQESRECQCPGCYRKKRHITSSEPWRGTKNFLTKSSIVIGWVLLALLAYKVSQFDYEMANFDPYEILGIGSGATQREIRQQYRKLSVILHPDKETGNEKEFMKLTKAYQALTDDEARKNWEKYGNPDGPGAMSFGIALPSWIVEKENSVWVLGLYALVFMVALPTVVGTWWYRSIRFSGDQVLLDTTQMYYFYFHKTPNMALKRVIMILAASLEFDKRHNSEVIERQTDNEEVPHLIKQLPNLGEKNKERPLCHLYSIKARALLHAHLSRISVNPTTLEHDRCFVIGKCPYLIQEQVNCVNQLIVLAYARRIPKLPSIETIENCMKLCPMVVQGMWEYKSPLLQLPHITDDNVKFFMTKKRQVKTIQQFVQLKGDERRAVLRNMPDHEYQNVMKVLGRMPYIDFQVTVEVMDDENPTEVTAGAIVTVTVTLIRKDMSALFGDETIVESQPLTESGSPDEQNTGGDAPDVAPVVKKPVWLKQKKGGGKKNNKKTNRQNRVTAAKTVTKPEESSPQVVVVTKQNRNDESPKKKDNGVVAAAATTAGDEDSDDGTDGSDVEVNEKEDRSSEEEIKSSGMEDDDQEWEKFQNRLQKREKLEGKSKSSHSVHCPKFPGDKQEYWWTYICDRKSRTLLTAPYHVTSLVDREDCQLKFTAPNWPGVYTVTCCLRSDSYLGFDQQRDIKLDVKEAPAEITEHPQWEFDDSEEEGKAVEESHDSEYTTDDDLPDD